MIIFYFIFISFSASHLSNSNTSDLNLALSAALKDIQDEGFFEGFYHRHFDTFGGEIKHFECDVNWPDVNDQCSGPIMLLHEQPTDLELALSRGHIRIGYSSFSKSKPFIYKNEYGILSGYEIDQAKLAVFKIGEQYDTILEAQFVEMMSENEFDSQKTMIKALNDGFSNFFLFIYLK